MYDIINQTPKQVLIHVHTASGPYPMTVTQKAFGSRPITKDSVQVSDEDGNPLSEMYELTWEQTLMGVAEQVQASLGAPA